MQRYIILTLLTFSLLLSEEADHVIFNKITIRPNDAEMVSIHNPTESIIDLSNYYISDAEYSDIRESHASLTYYQGNIYWGWHSGYYYYYGTPHYYPWYYYYNTCPPSHYTHTTHIVITRPVNKPTHRPNNKVNVIIKSNTNVKTNINRNKVNIKTNRSNNSNKKSTNTRRRPK